MSTRYVYVVNLTKYDPRVFSTPDKALDFLARESGKNNYLGEIKVVLINREHDPLCLDDDSLGVRYYDVADPNLRETFKAHLKKKMALQLEYEYDGQPRSTFLDKVAIC